MTENKKEPEIYFLRHAQSTFNAGLCDEFDAGLSELGKKQASNLIGNIDLVIVSSLKRTFQTLQESKILYRKLLVSSLCRENRNVSKCDYLPNEVCIEESTEQLDARITEFKALLKLLSETYQRILVVSHGGFIGRFLGRNNMNNCEYVQWKP